MVRRCAQNTCPRGQSDEDCEEPQTHTTHVVRILLERPTTVVAVVRERRAAGYVSGRFDCSATWACAMAIAISCLKRAAELAQVWAVGNAQLAEGSAIIPSLRADDLPDLRHRLHSSVWPRVITPA
jgi:hypothetical protein